MSRLDEILHGLQAETKAEEQLQRELDELRKASVAAIKLGIAARAKLLAPEQEPLGSAEVADRNYKRARKMKALRNQGGVE